MLKKRKSEASGNVGGYESTFQKCRNSDQRRRDIISMKMRVHDNLGYSVLATQRMLMRESEEDRDMFLSQWEADIRPAE